MLQRVLAATILLVVPAAAALGDAKPRSTPLFDSTIATSDNNAASRPVHIRVVAWDLRPNRGEPQEIPLSGFYVAYLRSGTIATTSGGPPIVRRAGSFWAVPAGVGMQIKVLGDAAVLETIVLTKSRS